MFKKDSNIQLQGDPRICKEGMQKNVRFVGDNPRSSQAIIQLDGAFQFLRKRTNSSQFQQRSPPFSPKGHCWTSSWNSSGAGTPKMTFRGKCNGSTNKSRVSADSFLNWSPPPIRLSRSCSFSLLPFSDLSLQTIHLPETQITFCSSGLTDRPAQDIGFTTEGHQVNLVQYYQQKYGRRLQYPRLPCVIHRRGSNESFFPIEVLVIV